MIEESKKRVGIFRFGVISDFVNGSRLTRREKKELLREKCSRKWEIPFSCRTRISRGTIRRWIRMYDGTLESLYPQDRCDQGQSRAMDEDTCLSLKRLKEELPDATAFNLISEMEKRKLTTPGIYLNPSTVYRFLHHQGLMDNNAVMPRDRRRFEAPLPNEIWQSDVMHGPKVLVDDRMRKTYLIAFMDDHSRLVPHGEFYMSEQLVSFLNAFEQALSKRGLPRKLYVDNGPAFRSKHLEEITASLGIALIHAEPYMPQGKGKIERFFKTVRGGFLTGFTGNTLAEINEAYDLWLNDIYHQRKHSSTGMTPFARFTDSMECLRNAPSDLKDHFRKVTRRRVAKDRTITLNGRLYEGPIALISKQVELLYHEESPEQVEVRYQGKTYGMAALVNLYVNYRVKRDKNCNAQMDVSSDKPSYKSGKLFKGDKS